MKVLRLIPRRSTKIRRDFSHDSFVRLEIERRSFIEERMLISNQILFSDLFNNVIEFLVTVDVFHAIPYYSHKEIRRCFTHSLYSRKFGSFACILPIFGYVFLSICLSPLQLPLHDLEERIKALAINIYAKPSSIFGNG